ncbi:MAG: spore germination protein, partial [Clostridia bacterium]|nr:spore germination protein [Clostridia bacterium]
PVSILRTFFLIVGGIWGVWGIILLFCILLVELCSKESFGIPFTAPIAPFDLFCQRDVVFLADRKTLSHKDITVQEI